MNTDIEIRSVLLSVGDVFAVNGNYPRSLRPSSYCM